MRFHDPETIYILAYRFGVAFTGKNPYADSTLLPTFTARPKGFDSKGMYFAHAGYLSHEEGCSEYKIEHLLKQNQDGLAVHPNSIQAIAANHRLYCDLMGLNRERNQQ